MEADTFGPIIVVLTPVLVFWIFWHFKTRAKIQNADVLKAMIDKGTDITPETIHAIGFTPIRRNTDLRNGLIAVAIGLGFIIFGTAIPDDEAPAILRGIASFPILIGLALIGFWYFFGRKDEI